MRADLFRPVWLIALVATLACDKGSVPSSAETHAPVASAPAATPAPATSTAPLAKSDPTPSPSASAADAGPKPSRMVAGAETRVKLLEPGAEPRAKLRYRYEKGRVEHARLVSGSGLTMELTGKKVELPKMPDMVMTATIRITELLDTGSARRNLQIDRVEMKKAALEPTVRQEVEQALGRLEGLKGRDLIDSRGFIHELKLEKTQAQGELRQFLESMQQALGQMGAPFPEEEVGKGARWRIDTNVSQQGIKLQQTATYELVEIDGDKGRATIELEQRAPSGKVNPPGLPPGIKAELISLDSRGNGEMRFDLAKMVPTGHVTTKSRIRIRTEVPAGGNQEATMNVSARATFSPGK
jgi:hypothetical protein